MDIDRWMDRHMDGWMDGQTDRQADTVNKIFVYQFAVYRSITS